MTAPCPAPDHGANSRCPRCGGPFRCGVNDTGPCACSTLSLSPALLARLSQAYAGCLCLGCLQQLAAQAACADGAAVGVATGRGGA